MDQKLTRYTASDALLEACQEIGVSFLFSNLGSDHPGIIEGMAKAKALGKKLPQVIICPHEYVALSAAIGHYQVSGEAQGVFVHTDVGTQNLGGSLHNAARTRVPVFIFSGETPSTMEGELPGSRNSHINYLQNVYDQRGIVRPYVKWEYDIRTGRNVKQLVYRAMQIANTEPKGPVYLTGAREVLEEDVPITEDKSRKWRPIERVPLSDEGVEQIVRSLANAKNPVLVTSYLGRNTESVELLVRFCEKLAIPVIEVNASYMNFPTDHSLHLGFEGGDLISNADAALVIDSDVPWVPTVNKPGEECKVFYIDPDPIKSDLPLAYIPSEGLFQADSYRALIQLNEYADLMDIDRESIKQRFEQLKKRHLMQRENWKSLAIPSSNGVITPDWVTACLNKVIDEETIILNETITNSGSVSRQIDRNQPGTMFGNGGSSLGWNGGGALGAKLAKPDKTIVSLTGDGSYLFSVPASVHWMSRRYNAPFLTVIFNNQGWNATKNNTLKIHPDGIAKRDDQFWVNFDQPADLARIAEAAGGALALTVSDPNGVEEALRSGIDAVKSGRSAVIDVKIQQISYQQD
ncbi:acetolactate synthase [Bacillus sp. M6-12]|uniref:thiamine pyrophosphate-requiring protein n=1 Tax=Bacillus sp. M6-12 TaxID=2054166 RepID=UPI000C781602|nr:thiamine pyrophosphate-requiring protein [Bacillus sp. M6-12]PLS17044.1 acetolactate synthase [Bacillus sp. M6-12]